MKYLVIYSCTTIDGFGNGRAFVTKPTPLDTVKAIMELEEEFLKDKKFTKFYISNIIPLKG